MVSTIKGVGRSLLTTPLQILGVDLICIANIGFKADKPHLSALHPIINFIRV